MKWTVWYKFCTDCVYQIILTILGDPNILFALSYHHSYYTVCKRMCKYLTNYYIDSINAITLISD